MIEVIDRQIKNDNYNMQLFISGKDFLSVRSISEKKGIPIEKVIENIVIEGIKESLELYTAWQTLTRREKEIAEIFMVEGNYKAVAYKLEISIETVRTHVKNVYKKLGLETKLEFQNKYSKFYAR